MRGATPNLIGKEERKLSVTKIFKEAKMKHLLILDVLVLYYVSMA